MPPHRLRPERPGQIPDPKPFALIGPLGGGFQPSIENLNKLGAEGSELAVPLTATDGAARGFVFKRRKVRD
jgi:hypothetical protein